MSPKKSKIKISEHISPTTKIFISLKGAYTRQDFFKKKIS